MKYYKIDIKTYYDVGRVPSYVNGDNIPNAEVLFKNMRDKDKINIPVLDYFFLESFDKKEYWEWMLCDVYSFIRLAGYIQGWLISKQLKSLLERYNLSNPQYFYPSKLLYKNTKLDYYIFQFAGKLLYKKTTEYIDYKTSEFLNSSSNALVNFDDNYHYLFYEVGTDKPINGKSMENKLYINETNNLIEGNTVYKTDYSGNYYIVTEVRKNIGKTY